MICADFPRAISNSIQTGYINMFFFFGIFVFCCCFFLFFFVLVFFLYILFMGE